MISTSDEKYRFLCPPRYLLSKLDCIAYKNCTYVRIRLLNVYVLALYVHTVYVLNMIYVCMCLCTPIELQCVCGLQWTPVACLHPRVVCTSAPPGCAAMVHSHQREGDAGGLLSSSQPERF